MATFLVVLAALVASAVGYVWWRGRINVAVAHARVARGALLIDADLPEEFEEEHIPGALNIPAEDMSSRTAEIGPRSRDIVVYARRELRSAHAAHVLRTIGYRSVVSLGSMTRW